MTFLAYTLCQLNNIDDIKITKNDFYLTIVDKEFSPKTKKDDKKIGFANN